MPFGIYLDAVIRLVTSRTKLGVGNSSWKSHEMKLVGKLECGQCGNLIESVAEECPKCGGRRAVRQDWRMVEGGFVLLKT